MRFLLNTFFIILTFLIYESKTFALSYYQIREICQNEKRKSSCIKDLRDRKYNLQKGNRIEIPVIPFRK